MSSPAALAYGEARVCANKLASLAVEARLQPLAVGDSRLYLHASLAAHVAGWESYIERLISTFFVAIADAGEPKYAVLHNLLLRRAENASDKFNTPSWEKSRELLVSFTGYDPINDWHWDARRMSGPLVHARLNEILKVRHSFAHGFAMHQYAWNTSQSGEVRLTRTILHDVDAFFLQLVKQTEKGMVRHLKLNFGVTVTW